MSIEFEIKLATLNQISPGTLMISFKKITARNSFFKMHSYHREGGTH